MFGIAFFISFLFSEHKLGIIPPVSVFFLLMFFLTLTCYFFVGSINLIFWGIIWLPGLFIFKELHNRNTRRIIKKNKNKILNKGVRQYRAKVSKYNSFHSN